MNCPILRSFDAISQSFDVHGEDGEGEGAVREGGRGGKERERESVCVCVRV